MKKILILTGGSIGRLEPFLAFEKEFNCKIKISSFSKVNFATSKNSVIKVENQSLADFDVIYLRLIGKNTETAGVVIDYARKSKIRVVDRQYMKLPGLAKGLPKSLEIRWLADKFPIPKTFFGSLKYLANVAPKKLGFPFVFKPTDGRRSVGLWAPKNEADLNYIMGELRPLEKKGKKFLAQEFIKASQRERILVVGNQPIACITRGTIWRRRFMAKVNGVIPEKISAVLNPIPQDQAKLAVAAAKALGVEIAGVDILRDDFTKKIYLLEVNSAPRWYSVTRDTGISVEREIVKYLSSLI